MLGGGGGEGGGAWKHANLEAEKLEIPTKDSNRAGTLAFGLRAACSATRFVCL